MSTKNSVFSGVLWTFFEKVGVQILQFGISIVLARLLTPEDYGLIGLLGIFMGISSTLVDSGLTISLIRKSSIERIDESTVFYFNVLFSFFLYASLFLSANSIAMFFEQPLLESIIKVYALTIIINAFSKIQLTLLTKSLNFRKQFFIMLPSTLFSGLVGIVMALNGFGVWSLVGHALSSSLFKMIQLWIFNKWRPMLGFSIPLLREHLAFGLPLLGAGLLNTGFQQMTNIVFGKFFPPAQLGFYIKAKNLQELPVSNISTTLSKVTLPVFAKISHDDILLKIAYRKVMVSVMFFLVPILTYMMVMSDEIIVFLFGLKWLESSNFLFYLCAAAMLYPLNAYNLNILNVKGKSNIVFKLEVVKKVIISINLVILVYYGIQYFLIGSVIVSILAYLLNSFYSGLLINYGILGQVKDLILIFIINAFIGVTIYFAISIDQFSQFSVFSRLVISAISFTSIYFILLYIFNRNQLIEVKSWLINNKNK